MPSARTTTLALLLACLPLTAGCKDRAVSVSPDAHVKTMDVREGKGAKAEEGDLVRVHYTGATEDGEVLVTTYDTRRGHAFIIGDGTVIPGMNVGVIGMREGGEREIVMPPQAHYGRLGYADKIPPETTLVFRVEMLSIGRPDPISGGTHPNDPRRAHRRGPAR